MLDYIKYKFQKFGGYFGIGLDMSDSILRAVRLYKCGSKIFLDKIEYIRVPDGYIIQGDIKEVEKTQDLINTLIGRLGISTSKKEIVVSLPEVHTFLKMIQIANPDNAKAAGVINEKIFQYLPVLPDEVYIDYQIVSYEIEYIYVLVGACPKHIVDSYVKIFTSINLIPISLDIEAAAIIRSILPDTTSYNEGAKLILDLGLTRTGLILYDYNTIQFTLSLPLSGQTLTNIIAKELGVDYTAAEQAKKICGFDPVKCQGILREILSDYITQLIDGIKHAVLFYQGHFVHGRAVSQIILTGGGSACLNIIETLKEQLNIDVIIANPYYKIDISNNDISSLVDNSSFATAIGLALRALSDGN